MLHYRELCSVLCVDLNGKEIQKRADMRLADSLCYTVETQHWKATVLP